MRASQKDYTAWKNAPWGGTTGAGQITVLGRDWSGDTFNWKFSTEEGVAALFTLTNAAAGSQGVSKTYDPDYVHPTRGEVVGATIIVPLITKATLQGLTFDDEDSKVLFHQLIVTPASGQEFVLRYGSFTVRQGVQ